MNMYIVYAYVWLKEGWGEGRLCLCSIYDFEVPYNLQGESTLTFDSPVWIPRQDKVHGDSGTGD